MSLKTVMSIILVLSKVNNDVEGKTTDTSDVTSDELFAHKDNSATTDHIFASEDKLTDKEPHQTLIFTTNDSDIRLQTTDLPLQMPTILRLGHITEEVYNDFRTVIWYGIVPPVALAGIVGNCLGLCFLYFCGKLKHTFHIFLFALMFVDIIYLIITLLSNILIVLEQYDKPLVDYLRCYSALNLRTAQSLTYSTCAHLITAMSFERLINIVFPLKIKAFSRKYAGLTIPFIFALNIALMVPPFLMYEEKEITDPSTNETKCTRVPTNIGKSFQTFNNYYIVIMLVVARFVPGVATLIANIVISIFLARRSSRRAALFAGKSSKKLEQYEQYKTTVTLMILSITLLLSLVPSAMTAILSGYYPHLYGSQGTLYFTYRFVQDLGYCLRVVSAANDFILYILLSKVSRQAFVSMLKSACRCWCALKKNNTVIGLRVTVSNLDVPYTFDNKAYERCEESKQFTD